MIDLITEGQAEMTSGVSVQELAWATVDRLVRIFGGETKTPAMGIGLALIDKENNLPPEGEGWQPELDYEAAYERNWVSADVPTKSRDRQG
ncbi:MAG: hypothetical protein AB7T48_00820 [Solirubrobacterales bacterium]